MSSWYSLGPALSFVFNGFGLIVGKNLRPGFPEEVEFGVQGVTAEGRVGENIVSYAITYGQPTTLYRVTYVKAKNKRI